MDTARRHCRVIGVSFSELWPAQRLDVERCGRRLQPPQQILVFHYHKSDKAIVAWSRASGGVWADTVLWGAPGTAARAAGVQASPLDFPSLARNTNGEIPREEVGDAYLQSLPSILPWNDRSCDTESAQNLTNNRFGSVGVNVGVVGDTMPKSEDASNERRSSHRGFKRSRRTSRATASASLGGTAFPICRATSILEPSKMKSSGKV
jgi:hypothetical protein